MALRPIQGQRCSSAGDALGHGFSFGDRAALDEAAGGEEFGVEQRSTGGTANQIVREQRQLHVEQRTLADTADDRGHAVAGVDVAARLRAIFFIEHHHGMTHG
jgi:hypothetical protein